ncbi:MAG: D-alanyl-D-alanine carboxypeptidase [Rhodobacteraceae bacterium]|nr:D-alanyl-D-alanine carboxypeptidase [Paracoccaceae bacterium]
MRPARVGVMLLGLFWLCALIPLGAAAAPYAAMVMDARNGEVLHSRNADTPLHPASLTKMMTLYIAFQAVQNGEISLDQKVRISREAASEPPSKLGLQVGSRIAFRYLIRAAAVKSANDAATAIAEAVSGSESQFARRMNRTAKQLGMTRTNFKNAHGLTETGHLSTARDMTILGRHLLYDYPQYYNIFSRRSTPAGIKSVKNTNRRLLDAYHGADGIKTGYTRAAGFNLVASAERGSKRIIATVFGGKSTASRNAKVAELLDLGFQRAPTHATIRKPSHPAYVGNADGSSGKIVRASGLITSSIRPKVRRFNTPAVVAGADAIAQNAESDKTEIQAGVSAVMAEVRRSVNTSGIAPPRPGVRPKNINAITEPEVVTRRPTSDGGRHWGINVGRYGSQYEAEKVLLRTALAELSTLDSTRRKVVKTSRGFDANFMGMTRESADLACRRLQARNITCFMVGPS